VKWAKACKKAGIKPLFGVEHYITQDRLSRVSPPTKKHDPDGWRNHPNRRYHITTLAITREGWANQMRMLTLAHNRDPETGGGYWYKPRIDWKLLFEHSEGIVATSGCMSSFSSQRILAGELDIAERYLQRMAEVFCDRFFLEFMPIFFDGQDAINDFMFLMHRRHGWPLVVTNDVHYPLADDWDKRTFLLGQNGMNNYDTVGCLYVKTLAELVSDAREIHGTDGVRYLHQGIEGTHQIMRMAEDDIVPVAPEVHYPLPDGFDSSVAYMKHLVKDGWVRRGLPTGEPYRSRILKELDLLERKNFIDQILLVWCIVDFCKKNNIMVGTRGSAAGSLVCYCLGITDLDPLEFDLLFERFVDITRNDPPDIDMDIQHNRRHEVKTFLRGMFGDSSVADICTFAAYRAKGCSRRGCPGARCSGVRDQHHQEPPCGQGQRSRRVLRSEHLSNRGRRWTAIPRPSGSGTPTRSCTSQSL
jgi:DNA polymerase-3 subunit alpha